MKSMKKLLHRSRSYDLVDGEVYVGNDKKSGRKNIQWISIRIEDEHFTGHIMEGHKIKLAIEETVICPLEIKQQIHTIYKQEYSKVIRWVMRKEKKDCSFHLYSHNDVISQISKYCSPRLDGMIIYFSKDVESFRKNIALLRDDEYMHKSVWLDKEKKWYLISKNMEKNFCNVCYRIESKNNPLEFLSCRHCNDKSRLYCNSTCWMDYAHNLECVTDFVTESLVRNGIM